MRSYSHVSRGAAVVRSFSLTHVQQNRETFRWILRRFCSLKNIPEEREREETVAHRHRVQRFPRELWTPNSWLGRKVRSTFPRCLSFQTERPVLSARRNLSLSLSLSAAYVTKRCDMSETCRNWVTQLDGSSPRIPKVTRGAVVASSGETVNRHRPHGAFGVFITI